MHSFIKTAAALHFVVEDTVLMVCIANVQSSIKFLEHEFIPHCNNSKKRKLMSVLHLVNGWNIPQVN